MGIGAFNNYRGSSPVTTIAATVASQNADMGDYDGDAIMVVNQAADVAYVALSATPAPVANPATAGVQMIAPNGWAILSRKYHVGVVERYVAVILASGTGNVRVQIGTGG